MDGMSESDNASIGENGIVTVADYISRAESQSRQTNKDTKKSKDVAQVDAIAEHSPPSAPATTNGSNNGAADNERSSASRASRSSAERPAKVSYQEDSNAQAVVNGLS